MQVTTTPIKDLLIIEPAVFADNRGFFFESYNQQKLHTQNIDIVFIQDNHSKSKKNTIRGLHYQSASAAQTKLVRCIAGEILDVAVDLRPNSGTFGEYFTIRLSAENKKQLLIPKGFAHGFSVLSETAEIIYKCDNYYAPQNERGIIWNDPQLNIDWQVTEPIISDKDQKLPLMQDIDTTEIS